MYSFEVGASKYFHEVPWLSSQKMLCLMLGLWEGEWGLLSMDVKENERGILAKRASENLEYFDSKSRNISKSYSLKMDFKMDMFEKS